MMTLIMVLWKPKYNGYMCITDVLRGLSWRMYYLCIKCRSQTRCWI